MISRKQYESARKRAADLFARSGIALRPDELDRIEVLDFGLGEIERTGLQVLPLLGTGATAVRLAALLPGQTCPQHRHPPLGSYAGKEETFRCAWGDLYVYMPGAETEVPKATPPAHRRHTYTVWHETVLRPGDQHTSPPDTFHWFQAGSEGAVVWLFCSPTTDARDEFADPEVDRMAPVVEP